MQGRKLVGIGIDLVSWKRVERLLSEHPDKSFEHLLAPAEQKKFQSASSRRDFFARSFAAKEAYFKAAEGAGMGEEGFRGIEIEMKGRERFCARDRHPEESRSAHFVGGDDEGSRSFVRLRRTQDDQRVDGRFFPTPDGIGAQVLIWK